MGLVQSCALSKTTASATNFVKLNDVKQGNLVVLQLSFIQATNGNTPVISEAGWTQAEAPAGQQLTAPAWCGTAIYYRLNADGGGHHATINPGASATSASISAILSEFDFVATSAALDQHTNNSAATGTSGNTGTTGVTTVTNELVIVGLGMGDTTGATHAANGITSPATTGYTSIATNDNNTDNSALCEFSYKTISATGTQVGNWSWTASSAWDGTIATFDAAPRIDTQPTNQTAGEGGTATFTISATTSGGTLHYQWKDDGANVGTDSSTYAPTVALSDSGSIITCVVSDDSGSATSTNAILYVVPSGALAWTTA